MYQIMIVDDEPAVVDGLSLALPWKDMQIDVVHQAYDAIEALLYMEQYPIDLVIADIRMPGMDGLELIRVIRSRWKGVKCILLSGHAEFSFAREAIRSQVEDYLIKPVRDKELADTVRKSLDSLRLEWEEVVSHQRTQRTLEEHLPLLKNNLLLDLLRGRSIERMILEDHMQELNIPFTFGKPCALMVIRMEEDFYNRGVRDLPLMEYAIGNIVEELFRPEFELLACKDPHEYLVFVVSARSELGQSVDIEKRQQVFERLADQMQKSVKLYMKGSITVLVTQWGAFPDQLPKQYEQAITALRCNAGKGQELFIPVAETPDYLKMQGLTVLYDPPLFMHLLEASRWDKAEEKLKDILEELKRFYPESQEYVLEVFHHLAAAYNYLAHKNGKQLSMILPYEEYDRLLDGREVRFVSQLSKWAFDMIQALKLDMEKEQNSTRSFVISKVQLFIEEHLSENVSLQAIADHVYLHPVYLSRVYKLETGEAISDYLFRLRMDKAIYLLKSSNTKIYEISNELGYHNTSYFIKVFKRHFGKTPQEFRDC